MSLQQFIIGSVFLVFFTSCNLKKYDVVVYGGTPSGVIAAVEAAKHGKKILIIEQSNHLGGMMTSGLITAESEHMIDTVISGLTKDFYIALGEEFYDSSYFSTFREGREKNFKKGNPAFYYESKDAEELILKWIKKHNVDVIYNEYLISVNKINNAIKSIALSNGRIIDGKRFVDATYEGDLMAKAGVSYTIGRESKNTYNELLAGVRIIDDTLKATTIDANGNLLPWFNHYDTIIQGMGDSLVMTYNFRPTMTLLDSNKTPIVKPINYNPEDYDFLAQYLIQNPSLRLDDLVGIYPRGSKKYEMNNRQSSLISLGMFGANKNYTESNIEARKKIYEQHKNWTLGFFYFLMTDSRITEKLRKQVSEFGYAKDEFIDNQNFPYYLYIREGRRMIGALVQTEKDIFKDRTKEDAVFLGSHWVDCHHVQRIVLSDSTFTNEGRIWEIVYKPFEISYRVLVPKEDECTNLIVPVASSFSHVAFCTYRLEATWMQAGHVAGLAAAMSIDDEMSVQKINIRKLQQSLQSEGMIIKTKDIGEYNDYTWMEDHPSFKNELIKMYKYYENEIQN